MTATRARGEHVVIELRQRYSSLTKRERQVMRLVASGLRNKQSAWELGISQITLQIHRTQVMQKMRAASIADLVRMAGTLQVPLFEAHNAAMQRSPQERGSIEILLPSMHELSADLLKPRPGPRASSRFHQPPTHGNHRCMRSIADAEF